MPSLTSSSNGPGRASERTHLLPPPSTPSSGSSTPTASSKSRHHNLAGLPAWRFRVICAALWACTFFCALDGTVVATLLTPIGSAFHASNQASWLGTSYLLALCCFTPIYGRLSDLLGRREAQLIALSFFTVGTFLCAIAPNMYFLIAARCVAGMGGGGVASMGVIIFTDLVDLRRRGLWQGISNIFFGLGGALGGPLGGFISDRWGWRIVFFLQTPLLVAAGIAVYFFVRIPPSAVPKDAEEPWRVKIKRIDYLGSMTLVVAVASLLLSVSLKTSARTSSGAEYAWSDPLIWGLLLLSAVFTFLFLLVEARFALQPILPLSLMSRRTPLAVGLGLFCVVTNQFSIMYNIPLFFSAVRLESASVAGAHLLPYSLALGTGSVTIGYLMRRTGKYWSACVGSASLMVATSIMLLFWRTDVPRWLTWVGPIPAGFGYAGVLTSTLVALMTNVTRAGKGEQAVATSMSYLFRTIGQVLGVALSAALVQSIIQRDLSRLITGPDAAEVIDLIRHSTESIPSLSPAHRAAAIQAYDHALNVVFIANMMLSAISVLVLAFIKEEEMPESQRAEPADDGGLGA